MRQSKTAEHIVNTSKINGNNRNIQVSVNKSYYSRSDTVCYILYVNLKLLLDMF
jgi:hypothetical protein